MLLLIDVERYKTTTSVPSTSLHKMPPPGLAKPSARNHIYYVDALHAPFFSVVFPKDTKSVINHYQAECFPLSEAVESTYRQATERRDVLFKMPL